MKDLAILKDRAVCALFPTRLVSLLGNAIAPVAITFAPDAIRDVLAAAASPGVLPLAGGLPAPKTFPQAVVGDAVDRTLSHSATAAPQHAPTEGVGRIRECAAERPRPQPRPPTPTAKRQHAGRWLRSRVHSRCRRRSARRRAR